MARKTYGAFNESQLSHISPTGWMSHFLEKQIKGLTGHLDVAGFPFDSKLWAQKDIPHRKGSAPWWPYEQTAYWIDGFARVGAFTKNPRLKSMTEEQMDYVLSHADPDGYLGPKNCKEAMDAGRWSHSVFFRGMIAYYHDTEDKRVIPALVKHYLGSPHNHGKHRDVCNIEIICWLYGQTGNKKLLDMAERTWEQFLTHLSPNDNGLSVEEIAHDKPADTHGVTYLETVKQGAILSLFTGKKKHLDYTRKAINKIRKYHLLADGVPSSTEHLRGTTALDAHETCDIADFIWTMGWYLMATGESCAADEMELAVFNAFPGAVTKDFRQLQYFSCPNQVILGKNSNHAECAFGEKWMCYSPKPGTECCTGEVNRILPAYLSRLWMTNQGNPVAACYGPSSFTFTAEGREIQIEEETHYPFSEEIVFTIRTPKTVRFGLTLRIPGWCRNPKLAINGQASKLKLKSGSFFTLEREFASGDQITLTLPMEIRITESSDGGIAVLRGPLLFALPVGEKRTVNKEDKFQTKDFPAYEMSPSTPWQYALEIQGKNLKEEVKVNYRQKSVDVWNEPQLTLSLQARRISGWDIIRKKRITTKVGKLVDPAQNIWKSFDEERTGHFLFTPPISQAYGKGVKKLGKETIELVPYGNTLLRLTFFPKVNRR